MKYVTAALFATTNLFSIYHLVAKTFFSTSSPYHMELTSPLVLHMGSLALLIDSLQDYLATEKTFFIASFYNYPIARIFFIALLNNDMVTSHWIAPSPSNSIQSRFNL
jgi:hypothetical protein